MRSSATPNVPLIIEVAGKAMTLIAVTLKAYIFLISHFVINIYVQNIL